MVLEGLGVLQTKRELLVLLQQGLEQDARMFSHVRVVYTDPDSHSLASPRE